MEAHPSRQARTRRGQFLPVDLRGRAGREVPDAVKRACKSRPQEGGDHPAPSLPPTPGHVSHKQVPQGQTPKNSVSFLPI